MNEPLISVIVTCFNQEKFLDNTLSSVYCQTYNVWECLIVDDGSTDKSRIIAEEWQKKDKRFRLILKEHGGVSTTRNVGLNNATGEYIQFLDGDDFLDKNKFKVSIDHLKNVSSSKNIIISDFELYSDKKKMFLPPYCNLSLKNLNFENVLFKWDENYSIPIHCGLISKSLFNNFAFPESLKAKEDWIMWVMLFRNKPTVLFINEALAFYRIHKKSITNTSNMKEDHFKSLEYLREVLSPKVYEQLLTVFIKRYYERSIFFKDQLLRIKNWNSYKIESTIRKLLKKGTMIK